MKERFRVIVDVHIALLREDAGHGTVLLAERANTGYGDGLYHLPSGHLEPGETVVEGTIREAYEEVGVELTPHDLRFAHVMHHHEDRIGFFFTARRWRGEPTNAEPEKCAGIGWFPLDRLPANMVGYPVAALAHIAADRPFSLYDGG